MILTFWPLSRHYDNSSMDWTFGKFFFVNKHFFCKLQFAQISQILHFFLIIDHYAFSVWIFAALSILILNITNNIQIVDAVPQPGEVNIFYILRHNLEVFFNFWYFFPGTFWRGWNGRLIRRRSNGQSCSKIRPPFQESVLERPQSQCVPFFWRNWWPNRKLCCPTPELGRIIFRTFVPQFPISWRFLQWWSYERTP